MGLVGIIGGTGLSQIDGLEIDETRAMETPYGDPSHNFEVGRYQDTQFVFLARHGNPPHIPPHLVNYRANIWALKHLGAERIVSVNAVGAISDVYQIGEVVICDQIIDYTHGRDHTFFDEKVEHVDFAHPFDPDTARMLAEAARNISAEIDGFRYSSKAVYGCTQGPRLESAAEILRMKRDGCDLVGMTAMPEAALAAEMAIPYASLSLVINPAAGLGDEPIEMAALQEVVDRGMVAVRQLLREFLASIE